MAVDTTAITTWTPDQQEFDIFRKHFAPASTTDTEWLIFLETCRTYRLSPMRKQIYLIGRWSSEKKRMVNTPQISIGGLRGLALGTGEFEGTTEPEWGDEDGNWYKLWPKKLGKYPYAARIGVYRRNFRFPKWGVAYWDGLSQKTKEGKLTKFWEDMGPHMLSKCAEADALRGAFEERCGGLYIHEEMNQADTDTVVVSIIPEVDSSNQEAALQETASRQQTTTSPGKAPAIADIITLCDEVYPPGKWPTVKAKIFDPEQYGDIPDEMLSAVQRSKAHEMLMARKKKLANNTVTAGVGGGR